MILHLELWFSEAVKETQVGVCMTVWGRGRTTLARVQAADTVARVWARKVRVEV